MPRWRNQQKEAFSVLRKHNKSTNHFYGRESVKALKRYKTVQELSKKAGPNRSHCNERMQDVKQESTDVA